MHSSTSLRQDNDITTDNDNETTQNNNTSENPLSSPRPYIRRNRRVTDEESYNYENDNTAKEIESNDARITYTWAEEMLQMAGERKEEETQYHIPDDMILLGHSRPAHLHQWYRVKEIPNKVANNLLGSGNKIQILTYLKRNVAWVTKPEDRIERVYTLQELEQLADILADHEKIQEYERASNLLPLQIGITRRKIARKPNKPIHVKNRIKPTSFSQN